MAIVGGGPMTVSLGNAGTCHLHFHTDFRA
jgi:hypothetical protein